jgi:hypothetical protein
MTEKLARALKALQEIEKVAEPGSDASIVASMAIQELESEASQSPLSDINQGHVF